VAFCAVWNHRKAFMAVGTAYEPLLASDDEKNVAKKLWKNSCPPPVT